jgi:alpha-beta hydrolase superfamily lysophospholipase
MPHFTGVAGTVYYKHWTTEATRIGAVVFLHGFGEHSGLYHRLGNALAAAGIDLWALDQIGHGLSGGERSVIHSVDDLVENARRLTALAAAQSPDTPLVLAGHSLGAAAAAVAAVRDAGRFRGLVLSGAPLSPLPWVQDLVTAGDDVELALDLDDLSSDPFHLDELANDPLAFTGAVGGRTLVSVLPPAWDELAVSLDGLSLPVLLVHGTSDPVVPVAHARHWSQHLRDVRYVEFAGARHDVLNDTVHRVVASEIVAFVARVTDDDGPALTTGHTHLVAVR